MLSNEMIHKFAEDWYKMLDVHRPMVEFLPLLANEELEMVFPEATVYKWAGFEGWFQRVIRLFFDEVHTVKEVKAVIDGDSAEVKVIVQWEASVWNPPAAKSERIIADAYQTWKMKLSNDKPVIIKYVVDRFEYHEGSAKL
ncbi:MAG: hypothetical protein ABSB78_09140 [Bacteroidota bacterium]